MIDRILELSVRHRLLVIAAALGLALACAWAIFHTPIDAIPDLSENQVIVFTEWSGHSPREIEDQVTYPLSLSLQGVAGVRAVRSSSDVNFSMINVILEDAVDLDRARRQLAERLAGAGTSLPAGVTPRLAPDALATGQIFWYTVEGPGQEPGQLRALQDWYVRPQLQSVPGVAEVASVGGSPIEYQVELDPHRMRAYGVTAGDVQRAVARANEAAGGHVVEKANAEYLVRGVGWLGQGPGTGQGSFERRRVLRDLEQAAVVGSGGKPLRVGDVATVALGPGFRRGVLEKDGDDATGGVVLMCRGENPLEVTRRIKQKLQELRPGLPEGVHVVPCYDRAPLIEGAVRTVTGTLLEAMATAMVCVLLVLLHWRTSFLIALILPLAAGSPFAALWLLSRLGIVDVQTNVMSLAGIAISIGVLVDSAVVMAENVMHHLKGHFGDRPVRGDVRGLVLAACRTVGRPIFFSVLIMLLSFLPVFALGGMEGKMFHPLAFTKSFALLAAALLTITLVPALCTIFIRGRLRGDEESWLVRSVVQVYRPVLNSLLTWPGPLVWLLGVTLLLGAAPLGIHWLSLTLLFLALVSSALAVQSGWGRAAAVVSLVLIALVAGQTIQPLGREFITPLDEGVVMDMPITVPRASVTQSGDDLKARDMVFCRFPEVDMVMGKAGRAETPSDPAPLDMIETMISFRPRAFWPKRKLRPADAHTHAGAVLDAFLKQGFAEAPADDARTTLVREAAEAALPIFEIQMREHAYRRNKEFERDLGPQLIRFTVEQVAATAQRAGALGRPLSAEDVENIAGSLAHHHAGHLAMGPTLEDVTWLAQQTAARLSEQGFTAPGVDFLDDRPDGLRRALATVHAALGGATGVFDRLHAAVAARYAELWRDHLAGVNQELAARAPGVFTRLIGEELLVRLKVADPEVAAAAQDRRWLRSYTPTPGSSGSGGHHHGAPAEAPAVVHRVVPAVEFFYHDLIPKFAGRLPLWPVERSHLVGPGGELDRAVQMPGWTNVWTKPIQNRVDMLATGVNTTVGVRVLGGSFDDVVSASEAVAAAVKKVRGATNVVADPVRDKGYLEVAINREKAARHGVSAGDVNDLVETALGGKVVTTTVEGRERHPVRVRYARAWREDEEAVKNLPIVAGSPPGRPIPLSEVADVRIAEGPATIKSENGLLRNYVRLNVRDRDVADFVEEARGTVARELTLPAGVHLEWTGQFEHELRARRTLTLILPLVVGLIFLTLYLTFHDLADAVLVTLAVPGAVAGGVFFQWWFGYKFSVTVWIGYIACFGMATSTGIIMLVYLRQAVARAGGLGKMGLDQLRQAVLDGAVHRLRPKLLTEGTTILGLAPVLWATGVGAEVIKPMAAPVLGGLLIADEVIDLFLPVLFYHVRRRRWQRLHPAVEAPPPERPLVAARDASPV